MWKKFISGLKFLHTAVRKFFLNLFLFPIFGGIATICGVFAGYLGSHYDSVVFSSIYPFFWPGTSGINWAATSFYLLTMVFGMSFTGTYWAQTVTSNQTNDETRESLRRLVTLPPRGFLENYRNFSQLSFDFSNNITTILRVAQSQANTPIGALPLGPGGLEKAIRTQLDFILKVFSAFDSSFDGDTVYGANVMLFLEASSNAFTVDKPNLQARTKCIEQHVDISLLLGVLDLRLELSVRSDTNTAKDTKLTDLSLPVPMPLPGQSLEMHPGLVPGAPFAFALKKEMIYGNQEEIFKVIDDSVSFTGHIKNELRTILGVQAKDIQTLICIPIFPPGPLTPIPAPIGVLNIHKNKKDENAIGKYSELLPLLGVMMRSLGNFVAEL